MTTSICFLSVFSSFLKSIVICDIGFNPFKTSNHLVGVQAVKMPEIQLGCHTVQSHGYQLAKAHKHDWLILLLLVVIEIVLNVIEPFHRFVGEDMMTADLKYPFQEDTVPVWAVGVC